MNPLIIAISSLLVIALFLFITAFFLHQQTQSFLNSSILAKGEVIELVHSRTGGSFSAFNSRSYRPKVAFQTQNGEMIQFISSSASSPASYSKGEKVEVTYLASNPQEAQIKSFFSLRGVEFIFILLGFIFFSAAIGLLFLPNPS